MSAVALAVSLSAYRQNGAGTAQVPTSPPATSAAIPPGQPPDLSTMTPREAADRLYNRVMAASEKGDMAEAAQFIPMALQAYDNLGTWDNDARYHVAMIHLTAGDTKSARQQVDLLRKSVPKHLLSYMIEHEIAVRTANKAAATQAYKDFLEAYATEIATGRPEYQDHMTSIQSFQKEAQASLGRN